jgi:heme iron utilization protein
LLNLNEAPRNLIKRHLDAQLFAVLATQSEGQPYTNLMAFAETDDLRSLIFVTSKTTRKYANTLANKKVAVLIDSRTNNASDLQTAVAVTALGTIEEVAEHKKDDLAGIYLAKHPQLTHFERNSKNALMKINVTDYIIATFEGINNLHIEESQTEGE